MHMSHKGVHKGVDLVSQAQLYPADVAFKGIDHSCLCDSRGCVRRGGHTPNRLSLTNIKVCVHDTHIQPAACDSMRRNRKQKKQKRGHWRGSDIFGVDSLSLRECVRVFHGPSP